MPQSLSPAPIGFLVIRLDHHRDIQKLSSRNTLSIYRQNQLETNRSKASAVAIFPHGKPSRTQSASTFSPPQSAVCAVFHSAAAIMILLHKITSRPHGLNFQIFSKNRPPHDLSTTFVHKYRSTQKLYDSRSLTTDPCIANRSVPQNGQITVGLCETFPLLSSIKKCFLL